MLRRIALRGVWGLILVAVLVLAAMGLGALVPRPFVDTAPVSAKNAEVARTRGILILSNPIHTDIALPAEPDVLEALSFVSEEGLELDYPGVLWVIVGWGGRSFYIETPTWADLKPGPVFKALTWDRSVMHVRRAGPILVPQKGVRAAELSQTDFNRLLKGIRGSFEAAPDGKPRAIPGAAYDEHDIFFPANGGFNALLGCNTWAARMLREAGMRTGFWTPLPVTLDWSIDLHNQ